MRNAIFALATSALLACTLFSAGCPDDPPVGEDGGDLKPIDMRPDDLTPVPAKLTCSELIACIAACDGGAGFSTCRANCEKKAKTGTPKKFSDALGCGQAYCIGNVDAGTAKCIVDEAKMQLVNTDGSEIADSDPGTGMKACGACLNNSLAALFGGTCEPTTSPDCNPTECAAPTSACLGEM